MRRFPPPWSVEELDTRAFAQFFIVPRFEHRSTISDASFYRQRRPIARRQQIGPAPGWKASFVREPPIAIGAFSIPPRLRVCIIKARQATAGRALCRQKL